MIMGMMVLGTTACSDEERHTGITAGGDAPKNVTNVSVSEGYGSVDFTWNLPDDENIYFVKVGYLDNNGNPASQKVFVPEAGSRPDTQTCRVTGFMNPEERSFTITTVAYGGAESAPLEIKATPLDAGSVKDMVYASITFEQSEYGVTLKWENEAEFPTYINVSLKFDGNLHEERIETSASESKFIGYFQEETDLTYSCTNPFDETVTEENTVHVVPLTNPIDDKDSRGGYITFLGSNVSKYKPNNLLYKQVSDAISNYHFQFEARWDESIAEDKRTGPIDPYMYSDPLTADVRGFVLVFRYMANMKTEIQFFFVNNGGYATGGVSTATEVMPESADKWSNYVLDNTTLCRRLGWKGLADDLLRIDVGNHVEGVIVDVRNMRFITQDDARRMELIP